MLGTILFLGINYFYPPPGLGIDVPFNETVLEGVGRGVTHDDGSEISMKEAATTSNQVGEKIT